MGSSLVLPGREHEHESAQWHRYQALTSVRWDTQVKPFVVIARSPTGERGQWVMKPRSKLGAVGSAIELISARLCQVLGIPTPEPAIIDVQERDVQGSPDVRQRLGSEVGANFAGRYLPGHSDVPTPDALPRRTFQAAARILGFDVACDNRDRRAGKRNSNLLMGDDGLVAIDHQTAFSWYRDALDRRPLWSVKIFAAVVADHFLTARLHECGERLDLFGASLGNLSAELDDLTCGMPSMWTRDGAEECVNEVRTFLADVGQQANEIVARVQGVLS